MSSVNSNPIIINADLASWKVAQTLYAAGHAVGIRPYKISIIATATTVAGTVTIQDPIDNTILYPAIQIPASSATGTVLYTDSPAIPLTWRDFKVTGATAAGVEIVIWYRV